MSFDFLVSCLERRLKEPLPGAIAHVKMAPEPIDRRRFLNNLPSNVRNSGVLILFYPDGDEVFFPLIKRHEYPGIHSGQMALPGGKMEEADENVIQTALREAEEEIGVDRQEVRVLGKLSDLYIPVSNFLVSPIVGFVEERPGFVPDPTEVYRVVPVDLDLLSDPLTRKITQKTLGDAREMDIPYFSIDGEIVWGATAMILSELMEILPEQKLG